MDDDDDRDDDDNDHHDGAAQSYMKKVQHIWLPACHLDKFFESISLCRHLSLSSLETNKLLCSEQAAAAMVVGVGSFTDPPDLQACPPAVPVLLSLPQSPSGLSTNEKEASRRSSSPHSGPMLACSSEQRFFCLS